jgi:hypothetical protein
LKINHIRLVVCLNAPILRIVLLNLVDLALVLGVLYFTPWVWLAHRMALLVSTIQYVKQIETSNKLARALNIDYRIDSS